MYLKVPCALCGTKHGDGVEHSDESNLLEAQNSPSVITKRWNNILILILNGKYCCSPAKYLGVTFDGELS